MRFRARIVPLVAIAAAAWPALTLLGRCLSRPASFDHLDYTLYYAFALQALQGGWHRLYDLDLQRATFRAISPGLGWFPTVYTPAMAVFMVPFALLPLDVGYRIWAALLCASYVGSGVALAPGAALEKTAHVALSLVPYPVALGLGLGQPIALQMAALACAVHLLRR
ncbi:MAG: glycosyltransferase 87 family protein, partial [Myxococcales bacterium]